MLLCKLHKINLILLKIKTKLFSIDKIHELQELLYTDLTSTFECRAVFMRKDSHLIEIAWPNAGKLPFYYTSRGKIL